MRLYLYILLLAGCCFSCTKKPAEIVALPQLLTIPKGFPAPEFPADNAFTRERWELGKKLFFDPSLSFDQSVSCASCHHPQNAFSDVLPASKGANGTLGTRNSPTLANVAYHPYYTREGGIPTLEMQALIPIQEHNEFNFNIVKIAARLQQNDEYKTISHLAYDRDPDHFVITRALATFQRSLISGNSAYDKYYFGGDNNALSPQQKAGMDLFFSEKTNCSSCHTGFNFTNYAFENNGLYYDYPDSGRMRLTGLEDDRARFKVPTLRNVAVTSPYMHDGSVLTLEDIIEHYNSGGQVHKNKSNLIKPLNLSVEEKEALVAFLYSLTDFQFINNENFRPNEN